MRQIVPVDASLMPKAAKCVFEGVIFDVYQWQQPLFDGRRATFEKIRRPDTASILAVAGDKIILICDQQAGRGPRRRLPMGRVERNEDIMSAAQRELREETGYQFKNWRLVKVSQPERSKIVWFIYLYVAWGVESRGQSEPDAGERIRISMVSLRELQQMVDDETSSLSKLATIVRGLSDVSEILELPVYQGVMAEVIAKR